MYISGLTGDESRNLFLNGEVNSQSVDEIVRRILDIDSADQEKIDKLAHFEPEPIVLYINSGGGSVYDGWALIGAMEMCQTPIHTVCIGQAMSMALAIFLAGEIRYAHRHATLMYHEIWSNNIGKINEQKKTIAHMDHLQEKYDEYVIERVGLNSEGEPRITKEDLDSAKEEGEWFLTPKTAKKNGIVHAVLPMTEEEFKQFAKELKARYE